MGRVGTLLLFALFAACDPGATGNPCQEACDILEPGLTGTSCQVIRGLCDPPHAPNDYGLCLCTVDAKCPTGMEPWDPNPAPVPPPPTCP